MTKLTKAESKRFPTKEMHAILKENYKPHCVEFLQASYHLHELLEQHLADELARARKEERERIKANIGLLRQWLNERLEHDRLLTNEDLETWLLSKPIKKDKHE